MNRRALAVLLVVAGSSAVARLPQEADPAAPEPEARAARISVEETIQNWPAPARRNALLLLAEYGPPARFDAASLVWLRNGPWEKTVAYRDGWPQYKVPEDRDYLKQGISYRLPPERLEQIMSFDPRVEADPLTGELAARSQREGVNFLLLNLVDDIVAERMTIAQAREHLARTLQLEAAGKTSPYMLGLRFTPKE